ncbi:unknown [Eggerthella sp. CAG:368]|nr:unknown [Eggerthella sp. CAG:368]
MCRVHAQGCKRDKEGRGGRLCTSREHLRGYQHSGCHHRVLGVRVRHKIRGEYHRIQRLFHWEDAWVRAFRACQHERYRTGWEFDPRAGKGDRVRSGWFRCSLFIVLSASADIRPLRICWLVGETRTLAMACVS